MPDHQQGQGRRFNVYVELYGFGEVVLELIHPMLSTTQRSYPYGTNAVGAANAEETVFRRLACE
jgi:hypothetical protein